MELDMNPRKTLRLKELPPEVGFQAEWIIRVSKGDALLILKALGGRLKPVEVEAAKELGDALTDLRLKTMEDYIASLRRAVEAMTEGGEDASS